MHNKHAFSPGVLYISGSQTGGRDPFVGRGIISRGRERVKQMKCNFFVIIINIFQHYK